MSAAYDDGLNGDGLDEDGLQEPDGAPPEPLRTTAFVVAIGGLLGSIGLTLWVGHRAAMLLQVLFVGWVAAPFLILLWAILNSWRWSSAIRVTLYILSVAVTLGAVATYADVAWNPPASAPAFMFLIMPLVSWVVMTIVMAAVVLMSRGRQLR